MEYERLCEFYDRLAATSSRLALTDILVELVRETSPEEIARVVYLTQGKLYPDFVGVELGVADKLVLRALAFATGLPDEKVTATYRESGDAGDAAEALMARARDGQGRKRGPKAARQVTLFATPGAESEAPVTAGPLTVAGVYAAFEDVARASGAGSQDAKLAKVETLLVTASPRAAKYVARTVTGKLRLGIADMTILEALAVAFAAKADRPRVERAYNVSSDLGLVAAALARGGLAALDDVRLRVGVPVRPMLAERLTTPAAILEKLGGDCLVENKYDGLRLQAHLPRGGDVRFFSRRLEDVTSQFPDVARALRDAFHGSTAIVEGECVPVDVESGEIRPFQDIAKRRGRKHGLEDAIREVPVTIFLFDCLLADDEDVTARPLPERRAILERLFPEADRVRHSHAARVHTVEELSQFFDEAVGEFGEGIMCKSVAADSGYRAGSRGWQWIKFKRDYRSELADTLDLVVVGALAGRGRRAGWYGALLMAAYNPTEDVFETACKLGTGFDDETLAAMPQKFRNLLREAPHPRVRSKLGADYWFEPRLVAEVLGAELTLSPIHTAAAGEVKEGAGIAVRFPRFTGKWREDKAAEDATTTLELAEMYRSQRRKTEVVTDEA